MPNNINGLDLNIENDLITNIDAILEFINKSEINEEFIEHITTLKNRIENMEISNKESLENAINSKIMEFESESQKQADNLEALRLLQQTNEEFQKLSIIETKRKNNDSNKYIDYFTFINKYGEVEVLSFASSNILNDFIKNNSDIIPTLSAEDIFNRLKNLGCEELKFESKDEYDKDESKDPIVDDPEIENQEYEEVESYRQKCGVNYDIEITVSETTGERLYRIGDGLIKFRTVDDERIMEVLKQPTIKKTNEYDDLLSELDETPEIVETEIVNQTADNKVSYDTLEPISEAEFDKNRLTEIIAKRDIYDTELSYDEEHYINICTKFLLEKFDQENTSNEYREIIQDIMEIPRGNKPSIIERFEYQNTEEYELTDLEKEFARIYLEKREKALALKQQANANAKKLELSNDPNKNSNSGISTIVMLLEILVLALFVLLILRLDI